VDLVGYSGAALPASVREHPLIQVHLVPDPASSSPRPASRTGFVLHAGTRAFALAHRLSRLLLVGLERPDVILVQNPPGIPTLPLAWVAAQLRSATLVVDWHNLTSAMLADRLGARHALVRLAAVVERACGRRAAHNLFVSEAMATQLRASWGLQGVVFRDRPPASFRVLEDEERRASRSAILAAAGVDGDVDDWLLVLSPTSWTADEDFDLLIDAARRLDDGFGSTRAASGRILVVATGKGTLRERFERAAATIHSPRVRLATAWFEADEYPMRIAAADVGLCLHRSTSGLDLPMKVMDFFGSGVPVCALDYGPCLAEAVQDGIDGVTFKDAAGLALQLDRLASDRALLQVLRAAATQAGRLRWNDTWPREVLAVISP
jgi:beta-1,4-mannosyltransferase